MKNTTFKRRALISSICMLLVALVALGSATFAWFAANPNASAEGISLKTTASTGLVIKTDTDGTWSHEADLYKDQDETFDLQPTSQQQASPANFWKIDALAAAAYEADTDQTMSAATVGTAASPSGQVYSENIYCRLSDGSDATAAAGKKVYLSGITITAATGASLANGIRVAIAQGGSLKGTWAISTAGENGTLTTAAKTTGNFSPALAATTSLTTATKVDTGLTGLTASSTDVSKFITVYVYLDGQDSCVYSDNVGTVNAAEIISGIKVNLTLAD